MMHMRCWRDVGTMLAWCWDYVGVMLGLCWRDVGTMLAWCWDYVDVMLGLCWRDVGTMLTWCWDYVGVMLGLCCRDVGTMLPWCWDYVGVMLGLCWRDVGTMLTWCWDYVGVMLGLCWRDVGTMLTWCWDYVGVMLGLCWRDVGTMLAWCWDYVGVMFGSNMHLSVADQSLSISVYCNNISSACSEQGPKMRAKCLQTKQKGLHVSCCLLQTDFAEDWIWPFPALSMRQNFPPGNYGPDSAFSRGKRAAISLVFPWIKWRERRQQIICLRANLLPWIGRLAPDSHFIK